MRARLLPIVTVAAAVGLTACGSTSYPDTAHIVPAPDQAQTLKGPPTTVPVTGSTGATSTATGPTGVTPAATASVPSSGPLSTEPKITVPSGAAPTTLVTRDLVTGTGAVAKNGDQLTVDYVGALYKNGSVFASWAHGGPKGVPFQFQLGLGNVIKGWDQGLVGMRVGGRRELIIPASLGYGAAGSPPKIPANAPLIFIVDLLSTG